MHAFLGRGICIRPQHECQSRYQLSQKTHLFRVHYFAVMEDAIPRRMVLSGRRRICRLFPAEAEGKTRRVFLLCLIWSDDPSQKVMKMSGAREVSTIVVGWDSSVEGYQKPGLASGLPLESVLRSPHSDVRRVDHRLS